MRRTTPERVHARLGISLRDSTLAPKTRALYREAFLRFWAWIGRAPPDVLHSVSAYDKLVAEYLEYAWEAGLTRGNAANVVSASICAYPELRGKGHLVEAWYLLNAWARYEIPIRAPPMPALVALGLAWYFVRRQQIGGALILLAGYDAFLRTGEMLSLTFADFNIDAQFLGAIRLEHTKTGQRHAAFEATVIGDPLVGRMFLKARQARAVDTHPDHYVYPASQYAFYKTFQEGLAWLNVASSGFQPYSVRRGGATAFFRKTRSMEATLDRGRWSSARVARIYVNDGLAKDVELRLHPEVVSQLRLYAHALHVWLLAQ